MKRTIIVILCVLFVANTAMALWPQQQKLTASDGITNDRFGSAVAIDESTAIVAAYFDGAGSAYVFEFNGASWTQKAKLTASDGAAGDELGFCDSASISEDTVIIGAHYNDGGGSNAGAAYIFKKPGSGWVDTTETQKLTASDADVNDYFGGSVFIEGNYAIVGAPGNDPHGSAYVFYFNGVSWTQQAKLTGSSSDGGFGNSVSLSGNYAIVGAPGGMSSKGAAYIFERSGSTWTEKARLTASDGLGADGLGRGVEIGADYALAGAPGHDLTWGGEGAVYVYKKPVTGWVDATETAKLTASDAGHGDALGDSISTDGNYALISAHQDYDNGIYSGSAYIFKRDTAGTWTEKDKVLASDGATRDFFGWSVSISGDYALVGAYTNDNTNGADAGAAYVFERGPDLNEDAVKWLQLPDETEEGIDICCDRNDEQQRRLADDFECNSPGYITDVHLWGSWEGDVNGSINKIHLSIHDNNAADPCDPCSYSMPGALLWQKDFYAGDFNETLYKELSYSEWWWDPYTEELTDDGDHQIWQYDIYIDPCDAFVQTGTSSNPKTYWLDVYVLTDQEGEFGWKTSKQHWNDDAVRRVIDDPCWAELTYPQSHPNHPNSIDMAFAITTEPLIESKPAVKHLKWSQPPIERDPNADEPTYCGWDESSYSISPPDTWKMVADDFRCLGTMPITSIHWWGSYYYYDGNEVPEHQPISWKIGFWSNVPADPQGNPNYSYPEMLLHKIDIPAERVEVERVGTDQFPDKPSDTCYQYYVELEEDEIFKQDDFIDDTNDEVFWISIAAEYDPMHMPEYAWGWKTRPWNWMDDAVTFDLIDPDPMPGIMLDPFMNNITPIKYDGESYDVSFEFDTDPNYIKWEQDFEGIRNWSHYEDVNSTLYKPETDDQRIVVDDWKCVRRTPVTAIVWWGSYIGYQYKACEESPIMALPDKPDKFHLAIWTDVPAGADPCYAYSYPNDIIWEYETDEYDEVLVGFDKHPKQEPPLMTEPVFRYSVRIPDANWFQQPDYEGVFWLSIQAVYDQNEPNYIWGWTNHQHLFNDDAVQGRKDTTSEWVWEELKDQTGASVDMSFVLFTDPNECSTCANYNCDDYVNFIDYAEFAADWGWTGPAGGYINPDLNCDGVVNFYDLGIFCKQWLTTCP